MFEWKVEEMMLMNHRNDVYIGSGKTFVYTCEESISREDKIEFVDSMTDGKLSYIISLIEKFNADKLNLPHKGKRKGMQYYGPEIKTVSLKAWIKRNDTKYVDNVIDCYYNYGEYNIIGCVRNIQNQDKGKYDYYRDLVDEVFRRLLMQCEKKEQRYFEEHDEYSILRKKFVEKQQQYGTTFGIEIWIGNDDLQIGDSNNKRKLTIDELKEFISKYEQIDVLVEELTKETHIVY